MKKDIIGIIAEFNPIHNGHIRIINKIKKSNPDSFIVVAMSGEFVQRGDLAIYDKWVRAKSAIKNNVDLVVEIPPFFVLNNSNIFAKKAIETLLKFGVNKIFFGSEELSLKEINEVVSKIIDNKENINKLKKEFHSLPKAIENLFGRKFKPNDILGISYVLEAKKMGLNIEFARIKRLKSKRYTSATSIRKEILSGLNSSKNIITNENHRTIEDYFEIIIGKIITSSSNKNVIKYVKNNLQNNKYNSFSVLIDSISNKSFTKSRIRREIMKYVLELNGTDINIILAMNNNGKIILKNSKDYEFGHKKNNEDNHKVESFIYIKNKDNLSFNLSKKTIILNDDC